MMHPSLHQLLLVLLLKFATAQQPYYSLNGPALSPSASPYGVNSYPSPTPGRGSSQPPQHYALNNPQPNYHSSQSSQHYSYAPAPSQSQSQGQSKSQLPYGYSTQPQSHPQPQIQTHQSHQYGNVQPTTTNIQHQSPQPQYASQQYASPNTPIIPTNPPTPYAHSQSQQPQSQPQQQQHQQMFTNQQQGQAQFSNRQLATFPQGPTPFRPNQNMAMNAPPATSFTHTGPTPAGGITPSQFSSRRGPFDGMISRVKEWMPNARKNSGKPPYSAGMGEMHRLPKPPKYPLYDMPSLGMATPPPPPLMSPMAQMPTNLYSSFAHPPAASSHVPQRGGRPSAPPSSSLGSSAPPRRVKNGGGGGGGGGGKKNRRRNRPAPPPATTSKFRSNKRGQRPRGKPSATNTRNSYSPKAVHDGYDHPMASNVAPVNSPPLGRPLGFDEYMKRPSHSFTDDPWNFDPNAQSYNEGMNTHAMKYNYDPLGMNTLDTSLQTHLDINKMSYPGDIMNMESVKETPKPLSSQLGGWDLPPSTYRSQNQQQQNNHNSYSTRDSAGGNGGGNSGFSRFDDQHEGGSSSLSSGITFDDISPSASTKNSFNQYDPVTEASVIKAETLNPLDVLSSMGGIEFDLDSLKSSNNNNNNNNNNNDNQNHHHNNNNGNGDYADYKLSDHYSPSSDHADSGMDHSQDSYSNDRDSYSNSGYGSTSNTNSGYGATSNTNSRNRPQQYSQDYDQYSNSYNSYSTANDYGTRQVRANSRPKSSSSSQRQLQQRHNYSPNSSSSSNFSHKYSSNSPASSSSSSSSRHPSSSSSSSAYSEKTVSEGMGLFHDFIKDPNPTVSKSRARHSLYKALLS